MLAVLTSPCVTARAATFGPNLATATPDDQETCAYWYEGCTLSDPVYDDMELVLPDPAANGDQTGVVTAIHVLSGGEAPAQFISMEFSGRPTEAKPFPTGVLAVSEDVTLHAGMNNFNTNLPVDFRLAENGFESWSEVCLNILSPAAPLPIEAGGAYVLGGWLDNDRPLTQAVADLTVPPHHIEPFGLTVGTLLMSGEVTITTSHPTPPAPPPPAPPAARTLTPRQGVALPAADPVTLGRPIVLGQATDPPIVQANQTVTLPGARAAAHAARRHKHARRTVIARGSTAVPAGRTVSLTARLTAAGRAQLRKRRHLKATVTVVVTGTSGQQETVTRTVVLRLANARHRHGRGRR